MQNQLKSWRKARVLTQAEAARAVGVCPQVWSHWERRGAVPAERLGQVAHTLGVPESELVSFTHRKPGGRPPYPEWLRTRSKKVRAPEETTGTVEDMRALAAAVRALQQRVLHSLGVGPYQEFIRRWPRDSRYELLAAHHLLDCGCALQPLTPLLSGCDLLIVDEKLRKYAGDFEQLALVHEATTTTVFFPQIRIRTPENGNPHRVDLLVCRRNARTVGWLYVEIDGDSHEFTREQDRQRARDLRMPYIRVENSAVLSPRFFDWLLWRIDNLVKS